jgi:hypothetical protein
MLFPSFLCALIAIIALASSAASFSLENDLVSFGFDEVTGNVESIVDKVTTVNVVGSAAGAVPMLDFKFVGPNGKLRVGDLKTPTSTSTEGSLVLTWADTNLFDGSNTQVASVDLTLTVTLAAGSTVATFTPSFTVTAPVNTQSEIGIWDVSVSVPTSLASDENGQLFYPSGYGFTYPNPMVSTGGSHAKTYPCGEASMQFMSSGNSKVASGLYMGAADHTGSGKLLQFSSAIGRQKATHGKAAWRKEELDSVRSLKWSDKHTSGNKHMDANTSARSSSGAAESPTALSIVIYAPDSGVALTSSSWTAPYGLTVGVVPNVDAAAGRPLWAQAANIYKSWSLQNADWTRKGPITSVERKHMYPQWYLETDLWLNTHWQCHDIFNRTGGEPGYVASNTGPVVDKLRGTAATESKQSSSPIALHWYEWQQGPSPDEVDRYLFDTHYPDYFPSRTSFKEAVKSLKEQSNVYTFPYINGRISDINSNAYLADNGAQYCTKQSPVHLVNPADTSSLTPYRETYGSNATFCVTNPFTAYWQGKIADTCAQLVSDYDVAGVYIDQIGSAVQKFCWDSAHNHTLGGGDYWVKGYDAMMELINERVVAVAGSAHTRPMVTEDNAEPYMGMVQGLLSLNAFKAWFMGNNADIAQNNAPGTEKASDAHTVQGHAGIQQHANVGAHVSPAYPFVYGGYYSSFGAIWARADFDDHNYWAAKLSTMLITGTQLGWFSIAGRNDDPEDGCGPMGVGDLFLSDEHEATVTFLQTAVAARGSMRNYFNFGQLTYPPVLNPEPRTLSYTSAFDGAYSQFSSLLWQAWSLPADADDRSTSSRVSVVLASVVDSVYSGKLTLDTSLWFSGGGSKLRYSAKKFAGGAAVGPVDNVEMKVEASSVSVPISVPARGILVLEFTMS